MAKRTKRLTAQGEEKEDIRINKFLSEAGVCSRREADRYITEGKVKIDGIVAEMGSKVTKDSLVTFLDKPVKREEKLVLIAFNKPEGIVSTTDRDEPDNIIDFINYGMRIYPIGRLDKDSEGLILLTNDGNIVNKILRAENHHEKEYIVTVNKEINADFIKSMSTGVPILDTVTNPCTVTQIDKYSFNIILTQGLNRQIRRMCEYLGYRVVSLKRIRIMNIQLGRLKTGDYRNVTEKEIEDLNLSFSQAKTTRHVKADEHSGEEHRSRTNNQSTSSKSSVKIIERRRPASKQSDKTVAARQNPDRTGSEKKKSYQAKQDNHRAGNAKQDDHRFINAKQDDHRSGNAKQEDHRSFNAKQDIHRSETMKPEGSDAGKSRTGSHKPNGYRTGSHKPSGYKTGSDKLSGQKTEINRSSEYKAGSKSGGYKSESNRSSGYKSGIDKSSGHKTESNRSSEYKAGTGKSNGYKSGSNKSSDYKSSENKSGDYKSDRKRLDHSNRPDATSVSPRRGKR